MTHTRTHQRGCRILLWMTGLFFVGQIAGGMLLDRVLPRLRFPFLYEQLDRLAAEPHAPNIVFLGSSRFGSNTSGEYITERMHEFTSVKTARAFNAAIPAGDPIVSEIVLQHLLERGVRPRVAVIELCPESLNHCNEWVRIHLERQLRWEDMGTYFGEIVRTAGISRLLANRLLPLYRYRKTLCEELAKTLAEKLDDWLNASAADQAQPTTAIDWNALVLGNPKLVENDLLGNTQIGLREVHRWLSNYSAGGNAGAALERILQSCQANGITPILVGVPLSKPHRDCYVRPIEESYQAYVKKITAKYGCRYVEYRDRMPDDLFLDNHHAGIQGSLFFSRIFADEVLIPWWNENNSPSPSKK